ncbi:MAG: tRNA (adenosine(37)-N6)-threonylcarbamoyltransferase complex dimerization subunit type 1 TsaB [Bacteroidales bacterium]
MDHILNIETSTSVCSVSISAGSNVLILKETRVDRSHAALLTVMIEEAMSESGMDFTHLSAVAVSKGPGSYTGLRIGVSTAKGICYAGGLPLIATDTMKTMALKVIGSIINAGDGTENNIFQSGSASGLVQYAGEFHEWIHKGGNVLLCPMIDARRMEVYLALFDKHGNQVREVCAEIIDESSFSGILDDNKIIFFGDGAGKCMEKINHRNALFIPDIYPSAGQMAELSYESFKSGDFENTAYFEPFYLKDFLATTPRNKLS